MSSNARILIVARDARLREHLSAFLTKVGLRVAVCSTQAEAFELEEIFECVVIESELDDGTAASAFWGLQRAGIASRVVTMLRGSRLVPVIDGRVVDQDGGLESVVSAIGRVLRSGAAASSIPPPPSSAKVPKSAPDEQTYVLRPSHYSLRPGKVETIPPRRRASPEA